MIQYSFSSAQPLWEKIKTPTDFNLLKVVYLDSLHCWAAGDSGVIMFSSDQGLNWETQNSGVTNFISDIFFLNESLGWAITFEVEGINFDIRSKILKTTNGGNIWDIINYRHLNVYLNSVFFKDSLNGWLATKGNGITSTSDGGFNWTECTIVDTGSFAYFPVEKIGFANDSYGFAVGGYVDNAGVVWASSDSGKVWTPYGIGPDIILDFVFLDSTKAIALTAELEGYFPTSVLEFDLSNNQWTYDSLTKYAYVSGMSVRKNNEIWGASSRLHIGFIMSPDSLSNWALIDSPDSLKPFDISFADSLHGIAVGEGGYIFRYVPDKPVSVSAIKTHPLTNFSLDQNYPNPFNPSTKIIWQVPIGSWQTITIYNVLGKELGTIVDEYKEAGLHSTLYLVNSTLPSGVYFYRLQAGSYVETKKMLLLK